MTKSGARKISVGALTRVEGEGALNVTVEGDRVTAVELAIYEPPRFFEAMLRGRRLEEAPDITARICGICPVAYQMTSVHSLESALGIEISPEVRRLRRLLYCAEWIESHGVHMHLLHLPDFFQCDSSIELAKILPDEVNRGLKLKKLGNELLEVLGGRAVNPVNVAVGGFYRSPGKSDLQTLLDEYRWGLDASVEVAQWTGELEFPDFLSPCEMVALVHDDEYPMNEGRIESTRGLKIDVTDYEQHFTETQVPHSTALQSVRAPDQLPYAVGPLARMNLNRRNLFPIARRIAEEVPIEWPCFNPYQSIVARAIEVVHAYEEAIEIISTYEPPSPSRAAYEPVAGQGVSATEAPRGLIYNRYRVDKDGLVEFARIVPPTAQNQGQIESDLRMLLPDLLNRSDEDAAKECEKLIRSFDPCISCSTHFLKLNVTRK